MVQTIAERKHWILSLKTNSQTNIPIDRLEAPIKTCFRVACYSNKGRVWKSFFILLFA
jgi:hypothetical protein